jgi:hypothetical protein
MPTLIISTAKIIAVTCQKSLLFIWADGMRIELS